MKKKLQLFFALFAVHGFELPLALPFILVIVSLFLCVCAVCSESFVFAETHTFGFRFNLWSGLNFGSCFRANKILTYKLTGSFKPLESIALKLNSSWNSSFSICLSIRINYSLLIYLNVNASCNKAATKFDQI